MRVEKEILGTMIRILDPMSEAIVGLYICFYD